MNEQDRFEVPVALFLFKRSDTVIKIMNVLRILRPTTLFLIGDGPRTEEEWIDVAKARKTAESCIDWPCSVEANYAVENRGVFENIAGGAKWVFSRVDKAIFLEDDNLPQLSFFPFCQDMLERYEKEESIFWVCGTNYLNCYCSPSGASYVFTRHLMPCGWASWAAKFEKYYDSDFELLCRKEALRTAKETYSNSALYRQQKRSARSEVFRRAKTGCYASWDFQLPLTIRANGLYGISPCANQIENIGVDEHSIHGGVSFSNEMTRRFCSLASAPLAFPLVHPSSIAIDPEYEKQVGKIILTPFSFRAKAVLARFVKRLFGVSEFERFEKANMRWFRWVGRIIGR